MDPNTVNFLKHLLNRLESFQCTLDKMEKANSSIRKKIECVESSLNILREEDANIEENSSSILVKQEVQYQGDTNLDAENFQQQIQPIQQQEHQIFEQIQQEDEEQEQEQEQLALQLEEQEKEQKKDEEEGQEQLALQLEILHKLQQSKEEIWQVFDTNFSLLQQYLTSKFQPSHHFEENFLQHLALDFLQQPSWVHFQQHVLHFIWILLWRVVGYYGKVAAMGCLLSLLFMGSHFVTVDSII